MTNEQLLTELQYFTTELSAIADGIKPSNNGDGKPIILLERSILKSRVEKLQQKIESLQVRIKADEIQ